MSGERRASSVWAAMRPVPSMRVSVVEARLGWAVVRPVSATASTASGSCPALETILMRSLTIAGLSPSSRTRVSD